MITAPHSSNFSERISNHTMAYNIKIQILTLVGGFIFITLTKKKKICLLSFTSKPHPASQFGLKGI